MAGDRTKVGIVLEAFDRVTGPLKAINASLDSIRRPIADIQKGFHTLSASAGIPQLTRSLSGVGSAASRVGSEMMALGRSAMLYGGLAAAGIGAAVKTAVDAASQLKDLSTASGMSVESIQTLGYAFEQSGGNAESFNAAVKTFGTNLGRAMAGTGKMAGFFKKADPAFLKEIKGKSVDDALRLIIQRIARAKTDVGRLAIATAAVGSDAAAPLVTLAKEGALSDLEAEMRRIGVISGEAAAAGETTGGSFNKLWRSLGAVKNSIVLAFAPALTQISDSLSAALNDPETRKSIELWAKDFGANLPRRIRNLSVVLGDLWNTYLEPIWNALKWIAADTTRLNIALGVVATLIGGKLILAVGGLAKALIGLGWTLLTTPVGWFLGIVAALGVAAYMLIKHWDDVRAFFSRMWDTPLGKFALLTSPITWLVLAGKWIVKNWEPIKAFFVGLWDSPLGKLVRFTTPVGWLIEAGAKVIQNWEPIKQWFGDLFDSIAEGAKSALSFMEKFSDPLGIQKNIQGGAKWMVTPQNQAAPLGAAGALNGAVSMNRTNNAAVRVSFDGLPRGARVSSDATPGMPLQIDTSYMGLQGSPA